MQYELVVGQAPPSIRWRFAEVEGVTPTVRELSSDRLRMAVAGGPAELDDQILVTDRVVALLDGTLRASDESTERALTLRDLDAELSDWCAGRLTAAALARRLRGAFCLLLYHRAARRLAVVRDRLGLVPAFYGLRRGHGARPLTVVASAPLTVARQLGSIRPHWPLLARYVTCRYDDVFGHDVTFLEDVKAVPPASVFSVDARQPALPSLERYWTFGDLDGVGQPETSSRDYDARLLAELERAVSTHVLAGADAAGGSTILALSGGMDSTCVAAVAHRLGHPLSAFTASYGANVPVDEAGRGADVARVRCRSWESIPVSPGEFLAAWTNAYDVHDFPLATSACLGYDLLFAGVSERGHRRIATGGSGDDCFCGNYPAYLYHLADLFTARSPQFEPELQAWVRRHGTPEFPKDLQVFWHHYSRHVDRPPGCIRPQIQPLAPRHIRPAALAAAAAATPPVRMCARSYLQAYAGYGVWYSAKPPGQLASIEGARRYGLTVADPFVDDRLFDLAWSLPGEEKIRDGVAKVILRRVTTPLLPAEVTRNADKTGYDVPLATWLRRPDFRSFMLETLAGRHAQDLSELVRLNDLRAAVDRGEPRDVPPMLLWQTVNAALWLESLESVPEGRPVGRVGEVRV